MGLGELDFFYCFVLRFYGPVNTMGSCQARSVYLTTLLLDRLIPLDGQPVLCTFFHQKLTTAFLDLAERENGVQECKQEVTIIISHIKKWQKF